MLYSILKVSIDFSDPYSYFIQACRLIPSFLTIFGWVALLIAEFFYAGREKQS
jgi:hypothetical protein